MEKEIVGLIYELCLDGYSLSQMEKQVLDWMKKNISDPDLKMDVKLRRVKCIQYLDKVYINENGVVEIIPAN